MRGTRWDTAYSTALPSRFPPIQLHSAYRNLLHTRLAVVQWPVVEVRRIVFPTVSSSASTSTWSILLDTVRCSPDRVRLPSWMLCSRYIRTRGRSPRSLSSTNTELWRSTPRCRSSVRSMVASSSGMARANECRRGLTGRSHQRLLKGDALHSAARPARPSRSAGRARAPEPGRG